MQLTNNRPPPWPKNRPAAAYKDIYADGQPRGNVHVKALVMQLDVCGWGIATHDWVVSGAADGCRLAALFGWMGEWMKLERLVSPTEPNQPTSPPTNQPTNRWTNQSLDEAIWYGPGGPNATKYGGRTVEGMFKGCSFGMAEMSKAMGAHILKVPVAIPCAGITPDGADFNSSQCPFSGAG
jgi:hypothetical protein